MRKWLHSYTLDGAAKKDTYDSEMDARSAASRLGGTVRAI